MRVLSKLKENLVGAERVFRDCYRCDWVSRRYANGVLAQIEKDRGKADPKLLKECVTYAHDVLGSARYAPWLKVYATFQKRFVEGWIPDNFYGLKVVPQVKGQYGEISLLGGISSTLFSSDLFPDIGYYTSGLFLSRGGEVVAEEDVAEMLFTHHDKVVFKRDNSLRGKSVVILTKESFDARSIRTMGNGVFQNFIKQHPFFDQFTPNSVSTLRILTIIDDAGNCTARSSYLKMARIDETHVVQSSSIKVEVDLPSGKLADVGYANWISTPCHPDTQVAFKGLVIPEIGKLTQALIDTHLSYPQARVIGWDVVLDSDNNVQIMEWNGHHDDIKTPEAYSGPCYKDLNWERYSSVSDEPIQTEGDMPMGWIISKAAR